MAIQKTDIKLVPIIDESLICDYWLDKKIFELTLSSDKEDYIFYDGPPFATGLPHYGHILAGFIKDSIIRYQTQNNKSVPRRAGWDTHGLPIEYEIEKKYNIKTKKQILVDEFNKLNQTIVDNQKRQQQILGQLQLIDELEKEEPKKENGKKQ